MRRRLVFALVLLPVLAGAGHATVWRRTRNDGTIEYTNVSPADDAWRPIKESIHPGARRTVASLPPPPPAVDTGSTVWAREHDDGTIEFTNVAPIGARWKVLFRTGPGKASAVRGSSDLVPPRDGSPTRFSRYDDSIRDQQAIYGIPQAMVRAIIKTESDFDPHVVSSAGCEGLMQLMPSTARMMGVTDIWDPRQNIMGGARYLQMLAQRFCHTPGGGGGARVCSLEEKIKVLAGYHAGPGAVEKYGGMPPYETTRAYVTTVLRRYEDYRRRDTALAELEDARRLGAAVNTTEEVKPQAAPPPALPAPTDGEPTVQRHLRRAGELVGARRLPEAELEVLKALAQAPRDLRALKLLALVRFKLGRLGEAREAYRNAREAAPGDPAVRLNLGLIALKLDWFDEAAVELEAATRLAPDDARVWSYLGYAYARTGALARAAVAFRRAGQPEVAAELEQPRAAADPLAALLDGASAVPAAPASAAPAGPATATSFAYAHLVSAERHDADDVLRLAVDGEAHARQGALLATVGELRTLPARRRRQGRMAEAALDSFVRCAGKGELWLTLPPAGRGLVALTLDQDVLYLREDRVVAFDGDVAWESGRVPGADLALLQFRGTGRVVADAGRGEVAALRIAEGEVMMVTRGRLVGWLGRVVAQGAGDPRLACEGEGVLLLSKHGDAAQPVHERAQPGDHGSGAAGPDRPRLHR